MTGNKMKILFSLTAFSFLLLLSSQKTSAKSVRVNNMEIPMDLEWLTDDQLSELGKATSEKMALETLLRFYNELEEGETKKQAARKIEKQCTEWIPKVTSLEEREQLDKLHHTNHTECKSKVAEYMNRLTPEQKSELKAYWSFCEHVWYENHGEHGHEHHAHHDDAAAHYGHRRRRRDHHQHQTHEGGERGFETYFQSYLSWLSESQKAELKSMKASGQDRNALLAQTLSFYNVLSGEEKTKAQAQMQDGCKMLGKHVFGEEKVGEVLKLKQSGATPDEMGKKMDELIAALSDEKKKAIAQQYRSFCKVAFQKAPARRRREHGFDNYFQSYLSWLNDAQREEVKSLKASGKGRPEMLQKIIDFYNLLDGEKKQKAQAQLQDGCKTLGEKMFGAEKVKEILSIGQSSSNAHEEMKNKLDQFITELADEKKKLAVNDYRPFCKAAFQKLVETPSRARRSYGSNQQRYEDEEFSDDEQQQQNENEVNDTGDEQQDDAALTADRAAQEEQQQNDYELEGDDYRPHNNWMTTEQKRKVKGWRDEGHSDAEVHSRIHNMFSVSDSVVKTIARGILEKGCEAILERLLGEEQAQEIMEMRGQGASNAEIDGKIASAVQNIEDDDQRQEAGKYALTCRQILGYVIRRRRAESEYHPLYTLDELLKTHLSWLNDAQKEELKSLKAAGKGRTDLQQKTMEFYKELTGEHKQQATQRLQDGCREVLAHVVGKDNAEELKRMRQTGASVAQIDDKAKGFMAAIQDERLQKIAKEFGPVCRGILLPSSESPAPAAGRRRRQVLQKNDNEKKEDDRIDSCED